MSANAFRGSGFRAAFGSLVVLAAVAQAPFQCAGKAESERRDDEDPSEVLTRSTAGSSGAGKG